MIDVLSAFSDPILKALPKLPQAVLAFAVGLVMVKLFEWLFAYTLRLSRTSRTLQDILNSVASVILWVILIAVVFQSLGLAQVALAFSGSVAIIGVAIGAGANAMVQDIIAGLFLSRDRDFNVGYQIKTGDVEGIVQAIDVRKVRIQDAKGNVHILPTSAFDKSSWVVLSRHSEADGVKSKKK